MRTLLLIRHAKASHAPMPDIDRPLTEQGQRQAQQLAALLLDLDDRPQLLLASAALRAKETATTLAEALQAPLRLDESLYGASVEGLFDACRALPDDALRVALVGHNPGLSRFAETLTGREVHLATAACAVVACPVERWTDLDACAGACELAALLRPQSMDA